MSRAPNRRRSTFDYVAALVVAIALSAPVVGAQTGNARLIVDVVDANGELVPGATVTVTREGRASAAPTTKVTDAAGQATLAPVGAGAYRITAALSGFQDAPPVAARVRDAGETRVTLRLGPPTYEETVDVGASVSAPAPDVSVSAADLAELPPDPAVLQANIDALGGVGASVRVDGLSTGGLPPASTIQQIRIRQNSYDAEFHEATPSFVEIVTNSRPVPWQRAVGLWDRAESLQARNAFNPNAPSAQSEGLWASVLGNLANRASVVFYGNYSGTREAQPLFAQTPSGLLQGIVNNPSRWAFGTLRVGLDHWHKQDLRIEADYQDQAVDDVGAGGFNLPERGYNRDVRTVRFRGFWTKPLIGAGSQVVRVQLQHQDETDVPLSTAPAVVVLNAFSSGGAQVGGTRITDQLELTDVVTLPVGSHQVWRAGLLLWHGAYDSSILTNQGGTLTYSSLAAYTAGQPATFTQRIGGGVCCFGLTQLGLWVQDDFAISKTLNAALGMREELESAIHTGFAHLAPRGQLEWTPGAGKRTTLRVGGGLFHGWLSPGDREQTVRVDGIHQRDILIVDPRVADVAGGNAGQLPSGRYALAPSLTLPQTWRASVGIDRTIGTWVLHADYARARGTHLLRGDNLNAPDGSGIRPDPLFANVIEVTSTGRSRSDTLTTSATINDPKRRRSLRVNYAYGRTDNDTDGAFFVPLDPTHPEADWGPSSQDVRHRFSGNGYITIRRRVYAGTYWNYSSATPYTITTGTDPNGDGLFIERPAGVGRNSERGFAQFDQGIWLGWQWPKNPLPPAAAPRNRFSVNISATNVWNRVNRTVVSGVLTSPFFGQAVAANVPRRVYLNFSANF